MQLEEENPELNNLILDKRNNKIGSFKKTALVIATLSVLLIIVIVMMNALQGKEKQSLSQAILPPEPDLYEKGAIDDDPLFEPMELENRDESGTNIESLTRRIKAQSQQTHKDTKQNIEKDEEVLVPASSLLQDKIVRNRVDSKPVVKTPIKKRELSKVGMGNYYVQVGSFQKYKPNKRFIKKIEDNNYNFIYHQAVINGATVNKVLLGPYDSRKSALMALEGIRKKIEKQAYILKINN